MPLPPDLACPYTESPDPDKIRFLRESLKLTKSEVSRMMGVTASAVSTWESGKTRMPPGQWEFFNWKCMVLRRRRLNFIREALKK